MLRARSLGSGPRHWGPLKICIPRTTKLLRAKQNVKINSTRSVAPRVICASYSATAGFEACAHGPALILASAGLVWMVQQGIADPDSLTSFTTTCGKLLFLLFLPCHLLMGAASVPLGLLPLSAVAWAAVKMACGAAAGLACARILCWLQARNWPRVGRWSPYGPSQAEADIAHAAAVAMGAPAAAPALLPPVAPPPPGLAPTMALLAASAAVHAPTPLLPFGGSHVAPALGAAAASAVADLAVAVLVSGAVLWGVLLPWASHVLQDQSDAGSTGGDGWSPGGHSSPGGWRSLLSGLRSPRGGSGQSGGDGSSGSSTSSSRGSTPGPGPGSLGLGDHSLSGMAGGGVMEGRVWMRVQGKQEVLLSPSDLSRVVPYDTPLPGSLRVRLPGLPGVPDAFPGGTSLPGDNVLPSNSSTSSASSSGGTEDDLGGSPFYVDGSSNGGLSGSSSRAGGGGETDDSSNGIVIEAVVVEPVGSEAWWAAGLRAAWQAATANPPLTVAVVGLALHVVARIVGIVQGTAGGFSMGSIQDTVSTMTTSQHPAAQHTAAQAATHASHMVASHVAVPTDAAHAAMLVADMAHEAATTAAHAVHEAAATAVHAAAQEWVPWDGELLRSLGGGVMAAVAWAAQAAPMLLVLHSAGCVASAALPHSNAHGGEEGAEGVTSTSEAGPEGPVVAALRRVLLPSSGSELLTLLAVAAACWGLAPALVSACGAAMTGAANLLGAATHTFHLGQAWAQVTAAAVTAMQHIGISPAATGTAGSAVGPALVQSQLQLAGAAEWASRMMAWPMPPSLQALAGHEGVAGAVIRAAAAASSSFILPSPTVLLALHMAHTFGFLQDPAANWLPLARDVQEAGALLVRLCVLAAGVRVALLLASQVAVTAAM